MVLNSAFCTGCTALYNFLMLLKIQNPLCLHVRHNRVVLKIIKCKGSSTYPYCLTIRMLEGSITLLSSLVQVGLSSCALFVLRNAALKPGFSVGHLWGTQRKPCAKCFLRSAAPPGRGLRLGP